MLKSLRTHYTVSAARGRGLHDTQLEAHDGFAGLRRPDETTRYWLEDIEIIGREGGREGGREEIREVSGGTRGRAKPGDQLLHFVSETIPSTYSMSHICSAPTLRFNVLSVSIFPTCS